MIEIVPLNIADLTPEMRERCRSLLEEKFWTCLEGKDPWGIESATIYAVAACNEGIPIGIALATLRPAIGHARILSLYVDPAFRHQQIGTNLLARLESHLEKHGCSLTSYIYQTDLPTTADTEGILKSLHWNPGIPFKVRLHFLASKFHPPWLDRSYKLPRGFGIFPWKELTLQERRQLEVDLAKEVIPPSVSPFRDEATILTASSLGLRKKSEVIGWVIVNRIASDTVQYSSIFIKPAYKFTGFAIFLLAASNLLQQKTLIEKVFFDLNLEEADQSWLRFVKRRLLPYAFRVDRFNQSHHRIGPEWDNDDDLFA